MLLGKGPKIKSAKEWSLTIEGGRGVGQNQILIHILRNIFLILNVLIICGEMADWAYFHNHIPL